MVSEKVTPENESGRTVVELKVDSFKRLTAAQLTPKKTGLVLVRGRNAQGKSSTIGSILEVLGAEKADLPITEGAHGGSIRARLSNGNPEHDLIIEEKLTRDSAGKAKRALSITAADGTRVKGPSGVLKELRGRFADPVAFMDMPAPEQVKTVLHVLGLSEELERLEGIARDCYERRRDLGREADRLSKVATELLSTTLANPSLELVGDPLEELTAKLEQAKDHNAKLERLSNTMRDAHSRGLQLSERVERMRAELKKAEEEIDEQRARWGAASRELDQAGEVIEIAPILDSIKRHEEMQRYALKREQAEEANAQAEKAMTDHQEAGRQLEMARNAIAVLLSGAKFPIDGMAYDADKKLLTINGIPFSQASHSERLRAGAAIAMAGAPQISVLFVREGSLIDREHWAELDALAEAAGFQCWFEVVDSNREGEGIWIEDGEAFEC